MGRIKIITDSGSDIPPHLASQYNITVLPICVVIDGKTYYDGRDFSPRQYYQMLKEMDEIPTTSQVPIKLLEDELTANLDEYEHQIYVTISSKSSGGYQTAHLIKSQIEENTGKSSNITILDSGLFSMLYGHTVVQMAKMAQDGRSYDEIMDYYNEEIPKRCAYFMVDDLNHLKKGGRINPGVALLGGLLNIKPVLTINEGLVDVYKKERGRMRALNALVEYALADMSRPEETQIWIANGCADEGCQYATEKLLEKITPKGINEFDIGCVIGTHAGPGLAGIIFSK